MLAFPEQLLNGRIPHRDFLHLYGPGSLWLLAAVFKVFGTSLTVERLVGLAPARRVGLRHVRAPAAVGAAGVDRRRPRLDRHPHLAARADGHGLERRDRVRASARSRSALRRTRTTRRGVVATTGSWWPGVLGGVALLFRPDLVLAVVLGLGAAGVVGRTAPRRIRLWGGAVVTAASATASTCSSRGSATPSRGCSSSRCSTSEVGGRCRCRRRGVRSTGSSSAPGRCARCGWPLPMLERVPPDLPVVLAGPRSRSWWCSQAAWAVRRAAPGSVRATTLWPAALFGAALLPQALQRPDTAHLSWVTGVTFALAIPAMVELLERGTGLPGRPSRRRWIAIGVVAAILVAVIPFYPVRTYADLVGQTFGRNRFGFPIEPGRPHLLLRGPRRAPATPRRWSTRSPRSPNRGSG